MYAIGKHREFQDRKDAGEQLGQYLKPKYGTQDPLVIGIPRGGVEVGFYVAGILKAEFSLIISRKLGFPGNEGLGFGAVSEESEVYVSVAGRELLPARIIEHIIDEQVAEVRRRKKLYRNDLPLPDMKGRTVILVDDGIAMGVTLVPVIRLCRRKLASKVIVAAPVSGGHYDDHLNQADAIEILVRPEDFYGVGQAYDKFGDFRDEQVLALLKAYIK
jgi:predicted phosphoribosyltransferase